MVFERNPYNFGRRILDNCLQIVVEVLHHGSFVVELEEQGSAKVCKVFLLFDKQREILGFDSLIKAVLCGDFLSKPIVAKLEDIAL